MPQKLAIAIGGTVAVGSYEAGVLYEIIEAIAQHNIHPDTMDEQRIEVDIVTGASAGAMTACILVQKLLFEAEALRQPNANALYEPWVEAADLTELFPLQFPKHRVPGSFTPNELSALTDDPLCCLFSSVRLAEISYNALLRRYATGQPTPRQRHPAAATRIYLRLSMVNLNGVEHTTAITDFPNVHHLTQQSNRHTYTRHRDFSTWEIHDDDTDDHPQIWKTLEKIARALAVPFALRPIPAERQGYKPGSPVLDQASLYTDSGLLETKLLGLTKDLVDQLDPQHLDQDNRFYLYLAPGNKSAAYSNAPPSNPLVNPLRTSAALAGAISTQARGQDWILTSQINQKIRQFERQANGLSDVLIKSPQLKTAFSQVAGYLLEVLYDQDFPEIQRAIQSDQQRLRHQFSEEYERIVYAANAKRRGKEKEPVGQRVEEIEGGIDGEIDGEAVAASWLKLVQALEKAQDLGTRDVMTVYAITTEEVNLAGEQLFGLAGLLEQPWREFDYETGRRKAVHFLTQLQALHQQGKGEGQLYLIHFVPGHNLHPESEKLKPITLNQVSSKTRNVIKAEVIQRVQHLIDATETRFWVRWLLKFSLQVFLSKQLNRLLELKQ